jgi:hypothetical protein
MNEEVYIPYIPCIETGSLPPLRRRAQDLSTLRPNSQRTAAPDMNTTFDITEAGGCAPT